MIEIILQLLLALGITVGSKSNGDIVVIDTSTGQTYGIGVVNGGGLNIKDNKNVYYLIKDQNGNYKLVK